VIDARDLRVIHCGMPHLPSRPDDHYPSSAEVRFFAAIKDLMIHRARPQIALSKNSKPSSQRNRLVARF